MRDTAKVLVVDDEEANRDLLTRRLERSGFRVDCADSGRGALSRIEGGDYDIVLLDSMMPGMSGIEVLKLLRAVHSPTQLPVIMVTAVSDSERVAEALDMGANDYVTKPIDFAVALARIRSQLLRKKAEATLRLSEERYALAARSSNDGLWDWDLVTGSLYYSPQWKSMLGYEDQEIGTSLEEWLGRVYAEDRPELETSIQAHVENITAAFEHEYRIRHRNGSVRWMLSRGVAVRDGSGHATRLAGSMSDVTEKKLTDDLTKLPNRLSLMDRLTEALSQHREAGHSFALLYLDLDRFKLVNDSYGHLTGDHLLVEVGRRIREELANTAPVAGLTHFAARVAGDEFAVLLDGERTEEIALNVADRLLRVVRQALHIDGNTVFSSVSIGIVLGRPHYNDPDEVIRDADTAMYAAKTRERGRWVLFDPDMRDRARTRMEIETDLRVALEKKQISVFYQARVHMPTAQIRGFEALARWIHPERGMIGPNEFIPIAEETGLINELGLWVLREACRQMRAWHDEFPHTPPFDISVNLSPYQCRDANLVSNVRAVLAETGLPASSLQLEVTESLLLTDLEGARQILENLKAVGIGLKMDDFGTGYSCLRYLSKFPFDSLKIDRSFTMGLSEGDRDAEELVKTIVTMARNLRLEAIAEGVENLAQVARLRAAGCEYGQGYFYSRPVDAGNAAKLLRNQARKAADH